MLKAIVRVKLKEGVLDPQGKVVKNSLHALDFQEVENVRMGKFIELDLNTDNKEEALVRLDKMADMLLANPIIENYSIEIVEGE